MKTAEQILVELAKLRKTYSNRPKTSRQDSMQIVHKYLESKPKKIWWFAHEVDRIDTPFGFISHRGPARLVDLVDKGICSREKVGKYTVYRLN